MLGQAGTPAHSGHCGSTCPHTSGVSSLAPGRGRWAGYKCWGIFLEALCTWHSKIWRHLYSRVTERLGTSLLPLCAMHLLFHTLGSFSLLTPHPSAHWPG